MTRVDTVVVVPCYNEASRLDTNAFLAFAASNRRVGFLFVDDGSTDATLAVLQRLEQALPEQLSVVRLQQNSGKAEAVRRGVREALRRAPRYVGYWDADLATPLEVVGEFRAALEQREETLMVMGARVRLLGRQIERHPIRHYLGRGFATAVSLMLRLGVYDTQCGAKLFRASEEVDALFAAPFVSRWFFDVELLARLQWLVSARDLRVLEVPLVEWRDVGGSRLRMRDFARAPLDLLRIGRAYRGARRGTRSVPSAMSVADHVPVSPVGVGAGGA